MSTLFQEMTLKYNSDRAALVDIFMHGYFYGVNESKARFGVEDDD